MKKEIYTIGQILKSKGYALNRSWTVETENYAIYNTKSGGWNKCMISVYDKNARKYVDDNSSALDKVIEELKADINGKMWHE